MSYRSSRVYVAPVPKMPPGLIELMEGLTKDVLRNNPTNIYEFCADHMEKLLKIRDGKKRKTLSLQRKITKAQEIIRERAKQHRENYDNMLQQHYLESENDVSNSVHKDVTGIHVQQASTKALEDSLGIKPVEDVVFTGEVEIKSEKVEVSSPTQEIVENKLPNDICTNMTLENLGGLESNDQNKNINLEELLDNNITDMTNVNMGTYVAECKLKDVTQKTYANIKDVVISGNNFENTISGQNEESMIFESKDENKEACSTGESDNNIQSFIEGEDFESVSNIPDDCQLEDDKPKNNSEKRLCEASNETIVKCANVIPEELENNLNNEVAHQNVMDLETAAITIQKVFRNFLFKSKTTSIDDATNVDINLFINDNDHQNENNSNINANKERRGISRMDTVLQTVNEEKSSSLSTDDSSTLSSAATVIQAHIRGFLVRNKLNVNKSSSPTSLVDSDVLSGASLEIDNDQQKTKTVLNIHIVPERDHFVGRDESLLTSVDLSMDGSPRSMSNLHPHSYDLSERRKQLKREDAVQSVSPPSNNSSSKLSEDVDSVREILTTEISNDSLKHNTSDDLIHITDDKINVGSHEIHTAVEKEVTSPQQSLEKICDEMDVVTPFVDEKSFEANSGKLMHSSEFHDVVLPTKVSRNDTTVVRGFSYLNMKNTTKKSNKNPKKNKIYDSENLVLDKALQAIKEEMSRKLAAKTYRVPRATLQYRIKHPEHQSRAGPPTILTENKEKDLELDLSQL